MKDPESDHEQARIDTNLDERIAASLRRSFVPPAGLEGGAPEIPLTLARHETRVERAGGVSLAPSGPRAMGHGAWRRAAGLLAIAAAVVLLLRWSGEKEEQAAPGPRPAAGPTAALRRLAPTVGPLETVALASPSPRASAPDLKRLYDEAVAGSDGVSMTCGPEDDLGATLAASYGGSVALRPEADQMLSGPFASAEWPTATILRGAGDRPPVLVAESEATHRCCVQFELASDSGLNLFTWQLGDLVLTEISPFAEPQLLGYFEPELR